MGTLLVGPMVLEVSAMVDCGSTWKFISHLFAIKHEFPDQGQLPFNLKTIDGSHSQVYGQHSASVMAHDPSGELCTKGQTFLAMRIAGGVKVILGLPWLRAAIPMINWENGTFSFRDSAELGTDLSSLSEH